MSNDQEYRDLQAKRARDLKLDEANQSLIFSYSGPLHNCDEEKGSTMNSHDKDITLQVENRELKKEIKRLQSRKEAKMNEPCAWCKVTSEMIDSQDHLIDELWQETKLLKKELQAFRAGAKAKGYIPGGESVDIRK